ncbi:MAG: hypothetical protein GY793_00480 [Proteobacteria bacterium]|nr:hypothetical protein [Pseudomonadota bacterium]
MKPEQGNTGKGDPKGSDREKSVESMGEMLKRLNKPEIATKPEDGTETVTLNPEPKPDVVAFVKKVTAASTGLVDAVERVLETKSTTRSKISFASAQAAAKRANDQVQLADILQGDKGIKQHILPAIEEVGKTIVHSFHTVGSIINVHKVGIAIKIAEACSEIASLYIPLTKAFEGKVEEAQDVAAAIDKLETEAKNLLKDFTPSSEIDDQSTNDTIKNVIKIVSDIVDRFGDATEVVTGALKAFTAEPTPEVEEAPTPEVEEAPTPEIEEAPTPEIEEAPTPEVDEEIDDFFTEESDFDDILAEGPEEEKKSTLADEAAGDVGNTDKKPKNNRFWVLVTALTTAFVAFCTKGFAKARAARAARAVRPKKHHFASLKASFTSRISNARAARAARAADTAKPKKSILASVGGWVACVLGKIFIWILGITVVIVVVLLTVIAINNHLIQKNQAPIIKEYNARMVKFKSAVDYADAFKAGTTKFLNGKVELCKPATGDETHSEKILRKAVCDVIKPDWEVKTTVFADERWLVAKFVKELNRLLNKFEKGKPSEFNNLEEQLDGTFARAAKQYNKLAAGLNPDMYSDRKLKAFLDPLPEGVKKASSSVYRVKVLAKDRMFQAETTPDGKVKRTPDGKLVYLTESNATTKLPLPKAFIYDNTKLERLKVKLADSCFTMINPVKVWKDYWAEKENEPLDSHHKKDVSDENNAPVKMEPEVKPEPLITPEKIVDFSNVLTSTVVRVVKDLNEKVGKHFSKTPKEVKPAPVKAKSFDKAPAPTGEAKPV